jgi:hypothetical protein
VPHAHRPRPGHVPALRVAHENRLSRRRLEGVERRLKDPRVRLLAPDDRRVVGDADRGRKTDLVADGLVIPVEVGDDADAVAHAQPREQRRALRELPQRIVDEPIPDPAQVRGLSIEPDGKPVGNPLDRVAKPGVAGDLALERVRRAVEGGIELRLRLFHRCSLACRLRW